MVIGCKNVWFPHLWILGTVTTWKSDWWMGQGKLWVNLVNCNVTSQLHNPDDDDEQHIRTPYDI